jgi:WD40 repeat protein
MKAILSGEQADPTLPSLTHTHSGATGATLQGTGHTLEVSGIFVDMMGLTMVSCGYDGLLCFWNFYSHELEHCVDLGVPIVRMEGMRDANFVAVAAQDRVLSVYDVGTHKLSRRFLAGHSREITDLAFTPDGRRYYCIKPNFYILKYVLNPSI